MSELTPHLDSDVRAKKNVKIAIAVGEYNGEITDALLQSCKDELVERGVIVKNIKEVHVPGAYLVFWLLSICLPIQPLGRAAYPPFVAIGLRI